jgi:hypothetical protein
VTHSIFILSMIPSHLNLTVSRLPLHGPGIILVDGHAPFSFSLIFQTQMICCHRYHKVAVVSMQSLFATILHKSTRISMNFCISDTALYCPGSSARYRALSERYLTITGLKWACPICLNLCQKHAQMGNFTISSDTSLQS